MIVELQLPYPPSANRLWRRSGSRIHKSSAYAGWLKSAGWEAMAQRPGGIKGPYALSIQARRPDSRKRDIDNLIKPISDLLATVGVIEDDCDCDLVTARWVTTGEGVRVRVEPAGLE